MSQKSPVGSKQIWQGVHLNLGNAFPEILCCGSREFCKPNIYLSKILDKVHTPGGYITVTKMFAKVLGSFSF